MTAIAAPAGSEVIVTPGDYSISGGAVAVNPSLDIHGEDGRPRPRLVGSGAAPLVLQGNGDRVRHVYLENFDASSGETALRLEGPGELVEDAILRSQNSAATLVLTGGSATARDVDTRHTANGLGAIAVYATGTGNVLRNVTATTAVSNARAIYLASGTMSLYNVLAAGNGAGQDLDAGSGTLTVYHSAYRPDHTIGTIVLGDSANVGTSPLFLDAPMNDMHEFGQSPTVDAGLDDAANGALDYDGQPRRMGSAPDIGADELAPLPAAVTGAAQHVTSEQADVAGTADTAGAPGTVRFDYGTTDAYGQRSADQALGAGDGARSAAATLTALMPATTYHYRAVAQTAGGTATGTDLTFTTAAAPITTPRSAFTATLATAKTKLGGLLKRGFSVTVRCSAACAVRLRVTRAGKTVGAAKGATIKAGSVKLKIKLGRAARRGLRHARKAKLALAGTATAADGTRVALSRKLTIRR